MIFENVDNDAKEEKLHIVYRNFINRHGHRCVKEAELRNKDWSEDPTTLIKLYKKMLIRIILLVVVPLKLPFR